MKRVIVFLIFGLVIAGLFQTAYSQSDNLAKTIGVGNYTRDTLTASVDTAVIDCAQYGINYQRWVVQAYATTGTDTLKVAIQSADGQFWITTALTNTATGGTVTTIPLTTTPIECIVQSSDIRKIRLITDSDDASTVVFIVAGKRY